MCSIDDDLIRKTLIRLFFTPCEDKYLPGLKRAYRDFNRTLPLKGVKQSVRDKKKEEIEKVLRDYLKELIKKDLDQPGFDREHEKLCMELKNRWAELSIGQCQKWINMTLKYWVIFGEPDIPGINKNLRYFHIPIDGYIQNGPCKGLKAGRSHTPWSKIETYEEYLEYQHYYRKLNEGKIPLVEEFLFFNKTGESDFNPS